ncbi:MAG: hypothetical protein IKQ18_01695 [Clostridia bacterium]|nr:hypothetical protein [Clostridia bacterium]
MKKPVIILLILSILLAFLPVSSNAEDEEYQTVVKEKFNHVVKVSYDEVRYGKKPNGSDETKYITCNGKAVNIDTPHLPKDTRCAIFWGWVSADGSDIESFSYVQEGNPAWSNSAASFKVEAEEAVKKTGPGEFDYRFKIPVEVDPANITTVQLFAHFADGTKEEIWRARVYVPPFDESSFVDPIKKEYKTGDINGDDKVNNKDVVMLFRYISGSTQPVIKELTDVNGDGALNNKDVTALFRYVSGGMTNDPALPSKRTADMYDKNADADKTAYQLQSGKYFAQHFKINAKFDMLSAWCPSWGNDTGNIRLSLYKYDQSVADSMKTGVIATKVFENYKDNDWLELSFHVQEPGDYILVFSGATEQVGVWFFPSNVSKSMFNNNGTDTDGEAALRVRYYGSADPLFTQAKADGGGIAPPEPDDTPILKERDAMSDTWVATDGLGRTLPTNEQTGDPKQDKYVGIFYWTWHVEHSKNYKPINLQEICDKYPEAITNHNHSVWSTIGDYYGCFWNEPVFGYYTTTDKWVLRKHAELLADAGVDVVIFDNTNGTFTWQESYMTLLEVYKKAREDGVKTPKISFILPFGDANSAAIQLRTIYQTAYKDSGYNELWFYWNGKPLMMSLTTGLNRTNALDNEIYNFFTFRQGVPEYNASSQKNTTKWGWLAKYPQAVYTDGRGMKQTTVGVAQNWSKTAGLTAMNGTNIFGRTYTSKGYDTRENAKLYGTNFAEQWEYAIAQDVNFVFVTGWNEWVAQKQPTWQGVKNAFPDQFNDEYSRDIEPSNGDLKDNYYYQLVSYIRQYKGTRAAPTPTAAKTIDINGNISQWDSVGPYYIAYKNNTFDRNSKGYIGMTYTNTTGRNDITGAKVSRDNDNLYFMVECNDNITSYTDKAWMRLFIDTGDSNKSWEGFEYVLNRVSPSATEATLERSKGGWSFEVVGKVSYKVNGKYLVVKIPKSYLGISGDKFTVNFKWNDNMQKDGDIMDFYSNGDTAPGGRFMYSYVVK